MEVLVAQKRLKNSIKKEDEVAVASSTYMEWVDTVGFFLFVLPLWEKFNFYFSFIVIFLPIMKKMIR
jgi:hypothetical protein